MTPTTRAGRSCLSERHGLPERDGAAAPNAGFQHEIWRQPSRELSEFSPDFTLEDTAEAFSRCNSAAVAYILRSEGPSDIRWGELLYGLLARLAQSDAAKLRSDAGEADMSPALVKACIETAKVTLAGYPVPTQTQSGGTRLGGQFSYLDLSNVERVVQEVVLALSMAVDNDSLVDGRSTAASPKRPALAYPAVLRLLVAVNEVNPEPHLLRVLFALPAAYYDDSEFQTELRQALVEWNARGPSHEYRQALEAQLGSFFVPWTPDEGAKRVASVTSLLTAAGLDCHPRWQQIDGREAIIYTGCK